MDVQLYMFINGAWQQYNPKPATHSHTWNEITEKPTTFTPSSHSHTWSSITGKPTTFTPSSHSHTWSEITEKPTIPTDLTGWTQVWFGSVNLNSYTSGWYTATVPSGSYIGKRIAIEVQYSTGTTYTSKIIFGVLGNNSTTTASASVSRGIGWSYFDGTNLRVKTLYAYASTSFPTTIYVGHLKTLFGTFSGTTIEWKTSHSETLYMKKIWVIE